MTACRPWMPANKRLPVQPLLDRLMLPDIEALRSLTNSYGDNSQRWADRGLALRTGDRIAVRFAHVHPVEIWGDLWWEDVLP